MAQQITTRQYCSHEDSDWVEPIARPTVVRSASTWRAQGELFSNSLLPRQLPVFKYGPEDEVTYH